MLILPAGISCFSFWVECVKLLVCYPVESHAAFLAKIMQRIIRRSNLRLKCWFSSDTASEKPMSANGIAKTV